MLLYRKLLKFLNYILGSYLIKKKFFSRYAENFLCKILMLGN